MRKISAGCALLGGFILLASPSAHAEEESGGMQSPAAFGSGVALSSIGAGGVIAGAYYFTRGAGACDGIDRDSVPTASQVEACTSGVNQQLGGVIGLVTGGAFFLAGIPAIAVGATPKDGEPSEVHATLLVGPANASLVLAF